MKKRKFISIYIAFSLFFYFSVAHAGSCAETTIENLYEESDFVVVVENLSNKLDRDQFITSYLSQRKNLDGYDNKIYSKKAEEEWLRYARENRGSYFYVRSSLKGDKRNGDIIAVNDISMRYMIGKTYILFISNPLKSERQLIVDSCIRFNFSDKEFMKFDTILSGPQTFEAAMDRLMSVVDGAKQKNESSSTVL